MKIKQIGTCYSLIIGQLIGIVFLGIELWIGMGIIFVCTGIQFIYATISILKTSKAKICPECKTAIPQFIRICPECGHLYQQGVSEEKLTEIIEKEKEEKMRSEEIDCDFEKIEEIAVEEIAAYDGDIEEFLKKREKEDF